MMNRTSMPRLLTAVVGIAALSAVMTVPAVAQTRASAKVRVAHFSPDTPGVDVYLDGKRAVGNMGFRTVTDYLSVPEGEHQLALRPSGASPTSPAVLTGAATLDGGKAYTVAGLGPRAELHVGVFVDEEQAPPAGKANIRVVQAVVGTTAVDVTLGGGEPAFNDTKFGDATDYRAVAPGNYDISLTDTSGTSLLRSTPLEFSPGLTYTLAAIGGGDSPVRVLPVVDLRAAAAAPAGGVATGAGGTAVRSHARSVPVPLVVGVLAVCLAGGMLLGRRRRVV
jgi:uncharacterized protein DUF4397